VPGGIVVTITGRLNTILGEEHFPNDVCGKVPVSYIPGSQPRQMISLSVLFLFFRELTPVEVT
jgi:hypothetical protein